MDFAKYFKKSQYFIEAMNDRELNNLPKTFQYGQSYIEDKETVKGYWQDERRHLILK